jgi:hypothetical protein
VSRIVFVVLTLIPLLVLGIAGCGKSESKPGAQAQQSTLPETLWLKSAPLDAQSAAAIREKAKTGQKVAVAGVVGGRKQAFTDGLAAFTIVDRELPKCAEDHCETPWDYCCEPLENLKKNMVTIEVREGSSPLKSTARGFHGLDHMKNVVVTGEAQRDEAGNVIVVASGIFVEP